VNDTGSSLQISYQNGNVCFVGRLGAGGWGAVFNLTFNYNASSGREEVWNARSYGVTGFELTSACGSARCLERPLARQGADAVPKALRSRALAAV
jgi:hypothetical protein